jgi:hypothetical protein
VLELLCDISQTFLVDTTVESLLSGWFCRASDLFFGDTIERP